MASRTVHTVSKPATRSAQRAGLAQTAEQNAKAQAVQAFQDLVTSAEEAYVGAVELANAGTPIPLMTALAAIAAHFYEHGQVYDHEARARVLGNTLKWSQEYVLNGLIYSTWSKLHYFEGKLDEARVAIQQAQRQGASDEISLNNLERKIQTAEDLQAHVLSIQTFIDEGQAMYFSLTGKKVEEPKRRVSDGASTRGLNSEGDAEQRAKDLAARMASLGIKTPKGRAPKVQVGLKNDGIDAAEG